MSENSDTLLEVSSLGRHFGVRIALSDVTFSLCPGDCVHIRGANGAGKSTLLSILAGLLAPSAGSIRLLGETLQLRKRQQRQAIGYAGERPMLYADLSIEESLYLFAFAAQDPKSAKARVVDLLRRFGIFELRERRLKECSQGVQKRAGLVRALLAAPRLVLLDEPFANLDSDSEATLLSFIAEEQSRGTAFLIAAHGAPALTKLSFELELLEGRMRSRGR